VYYLILSNNNPLHYKVYVDRGQTGSEETKRNAKLKEDRVWHIPPVLLRRFSLHAACSQRLRVQRPYLEYATSANP
jgi:hypothetical protein